MPPSSPDYSTSRVALSRASLAVAACSTIIEWYDFTLCLYFATVLSRVFFGPGAASLLTALGGFAVSYLMRPLGALFFGHIGDRYGRRQMMLLSMALMTGAMLATALLPTHAQLGAWAGGLLLLLRCLMAFSVGGEYTGVVAYLLEGARPDRRGLVTSLAAAASEVGALLAVGVCALLLYGLPAASVDAWGWRLPFLLGAALAGGVWLARSTMQESPDFERQQEAGTVPVSPLRYTLRHHRAAILRTFCISALGSITYYVGITYVPTFLATTGQRGESEALGLSTIAAVVVILVTPVVGVLSDWLGRKPVLVGLAGASALLPITLFALMRGGSIQQAVVGAVVLAAVAGGVSAVGAAATAEQFPGEGRLSGLALGATAATAVFGGLTPFAAELLITRTGWPLVPGAMIALVALLVLPVLLTMPETAFLSGGQAEKENGL
ncbi:MFS transporter [Hymenobacter sp. HSC-4F20]|uniref:MFS transporter n=1 Tax=Hymenobacter sp. HSC-4F20 TaxID=2864135 RepID=UPI001C7393DA|nr:MFS transporter [Hymenobacter sp. HSC-4F20]MBX0291018.1 MFS transporter [Hymenobacter sp. HSC-4F20]